jgi:dipeptidyl aminopeptidase/acylaminoacyl peptidase
MEFTEAFTAFGGGAKLSPDGQSVAAISKRDTNISIEVYLTSNGHLGRRLPVPVINSETRGRVLMTKWDRLELLWAPNGLRLALVNYQLARIFVWDLMLDYELPICTVQENVLLGIERINWTPDSIHILTFLKHKVFEREIVMD